jgi:hypothetical protein
MEVIILNQAAKGHTLVTIKIEEIMEGSRIFKISKTYNTVTDTAQATDTIQLSLDELEDILLAIYPVELD